MTYPRTSVRQMIHNAGGRLRAAGVDSPRVDAELLMAHALTLYAREGEDPVTRSSLFFRRQDQVDPAVATVFESYIARRERREPLQHIMGTVRFAGIDIEVGPGAFIPRPETELIVEWAGKELRRAMKAVPAYTVVDLCTGPGTLALGIAHAAGNALLSRHRTMMRSDCSVSNEVSALPHVRIVGVEKSADALEFARRNVATFIDEWRREARGAGLSEADADCLSVELCHGDVTAPSILADIQQVLICNDARARGASSARADDGICANMIVSNPPYVPESTEVSPEVAADPHEAVFAGKDGMLVITPMVMVVEALSSQGTVVAIEHDETAGSMTAQCLEDHGFSNLEIHRDLAGRDRFVTGTATDTKKA
ncbi:N5-glutamine methyltransferase family protein [Corynebacterium kroppenstedtii]|uniref:N5-glutamine methyltransferase family protein n=1 Tax=Corynebacterium sp. PCR 32 TaxID=3351342 RepID=UPI0030A1B89C